MEQLPSLDEIVSDDTGPYNYAEPHQGAANVSEIALINAISQTVAFKRLSGIRFLGALDYCLIEKPNGASANSRFTRAQHSLGVAALARHYLSLVQHDARDRLLCIAAAMLHDVGHSPLSHTLEPVFKERFGRDHHRATEDIILGKVDTLTGIPEVLKAFGVDADDVVTLLSGHDNRFHGYFSGPINLDTIEGILRSRQYLKMQDLGITPLRVVEAATRRETDQHEMTVDAFWFCKDEMYNVVIRSKFGVFFDTMFQEIARGEGVLLRAEDFYLTEPSLFRKYPVFREALRRANWAEIARTVLPENICYQARHFHVHEQTSFFGRNDSARYVQSKSPSCLTLEDVIPSLRFGGGEEHEEPRGGH